MTTAVSNEVAVSTWNIDPAHSTAQFKVKHMMISNVKGKFTHIKGTLKLDSSDITRSSVEASMDVSTINTREEQRDAHLKSEDFFHLEKFPTISFKSTSVAKEGDDEFAVEGELTMHGVTRNLVFDVESLSPPTKDPWGTRESAFRRAPRLTARILA